MSELAFLKNFDLQELQHLFLVHEEGLAVFHLAQDGQFRCESYNMPFVEYLDLQGQLPLDGKTLDDLFILPHHQMYDVIQRALASQQDQHALLVIEENGSTRLYRFICKPTVHNGAVIRLLLTFNYRTNLRPALLDQQELVDAMQDALFIFNLGEDDKFHLTFLNRAHQESTGLVLHENLGKTPRDLVGEEEGSQVEAHYRQCLQSGETVEYEEYVHLPRGGQWWQTKLVPVYAKGSPRQVLGLSREITLQKEREQRLQELYEEYESVFNNTQTPMAVWQVNEDETITLLQFNRASEEQNQWTTADYTGRTLQEVFPPPNGNDILENNLRCVREKTSVQFKSRVLTPRGWGVHLTQLSPMVRHGRVTRIIASSADLTEEEKQAEAIRRLYEEYEGVFNTTQTPLSIYNVDEDGSIRLQRFNAASVTEFGLEARRLQGASLTQVFGPRLRPIMQEKFTECLETRQAVNFEIEAKPYGNTAFYRIQLSPIVEDARVVKIIASAYNITDLRRSQNRLEFQQAMLQERVDERTLELQKAVEVKERFLASVSRELREPLTAIMGFSSLLKRMIDETKTYARYADLINENAHLLSNQIERILSITSPDENDELNYQYTNLENLCRACVQSALRSDAGQQIALVLDYASEQLMFWIDVPRVRHLLSLLLEFCLKLLPRNAAMSLKVQHDQAVSALRFSIQASVPMPAPAEMPPEALFSPHQMDVLQSHQTEDNLSIVLIDQLISLLHGRKEWVMEPPLWVIHVTIPLLTANSAKTAINPEASG